MEALNIQMAGPCRCGGHAKVFGPSRTTPHSHWGVFCSNDSCEHMVAADSLEEAIELWNKSLEPIHA